MSPPAGEGIGPEDRVRALIRPIWLEVLGSDTADDDADFFALGGDSIRAAMIVSRVRRRLGCQITLKTFLNQAFSLEKLVQYVASDPAGLTAD